MIVSTCSANCWSVMPFLRSTSALELLVDVEHAVVRHLLELQVALAIDPLDPLGFELLHAGFECGVGELVALQLVHAVLGDARGRSLAADGRVLATGLGACRSPGPGSCRPSRSCLWAGWPPRTCRLQLAQSWTSDFFVVSKPSAAPAHVDCIGAELPARLLLLARRRGGERAASLFALFAAEFRRARRLARPLRGPG